VFALRVQAVVLDLNLALVRAALSTVGTEVEGVYLVGLVKDVLLLQRLPQMELDAQVLSDVQLVEVGLVPGPALRRSECEPECVQQVGLARVVGSDQRKDVLVGGQVDHRRARPEAAVVRQFNSIEPHSPIITHAPDGLRLSGACASARGGHNVPRRLGLYRRASGKSADDCGTPSQNASDSRRAASPFGLYAR
jgi:hypothetical protein